MKRLQYLLLVLAFAAASFGQKPATRPVDPTEANVRRHIEYLASDKLEGRRTGEPGATTAAGYVANQFANLKLKPGATGKNGKPSYLQPFPYVVGINPATSKIRVQLTTVTTDGRIDVQTQPFGVLPVGFSPKSTAVDVPITFAGYGIVSPDAKYDDYAGLDVKGNVVLVLNGNPDNDNPHSAFGRFDVRTKALLARERGAVGMLIITREEKFTDDKLTGLGYDQSLGEAAIPTFVISRQIAHQILGVDEAALKTIEQLTAARKDGTKTQVGFRDTQPKLSFEIDLVKQSVSAYNVIGVLEGTDRALKNEAIVIGAHYDHLGRGGPGSLAESGGEIHHGADDNASGVAAIIELARLFRSEPGAAATGSRNKRTLIFIAFSGEEEGLFGSNFYVNNPIFPLDKTVAMINLDMVGRLNENKLTIGGIGTAAEWKQTVESANINPAAVIPGSAAHGGATHIKTDVPPLNKFNLQLSEDGFGPSDHSSFYGKKVPVLFFFTGTHNDYHKPSDTADKINYAGEHKIIHYVQSIARAIDQNPQRPTYTVAKTTMQGGRTGFNISLGTIPNYADSNDGLLLDGVRDGSPAAKAGLKAGDRVIKLAGHEIRNVMDYTFVLGEMRAGNEYEVVVLRGGERLTFQIVPVRR